jgi:purine nucleosidase
MEWLNKNSSIFVLSDASIDEYLAILFIHSLQESKKISVNSVSIVNADCIADPAIDTGWKIREYLGLTNEMPLGLSESRGWNPFPWAYRNDCVTFGQVDALKNLPSNPNWPPYADGDQMLIKYLEQCGEDEAVLLPLCPITPLTNVLKARPDLISKISGMVWMAGAVNVPGNLDPNTVPSSVWNKSAEWNIFWDPFAVDWLFRNTDFPIILAPLDVSDPVKVTLGFMDQLKNQSEKGSLVSTLAYQGYSLTSNEPFYRMWDVVAAVVFKRYDLYERSVMKLRVETQLPDQGALKKDPNGREMVVLNSINDLDAFYDCVLQQFNLPPTGA